MNFKKNQIIYVLDTSAILSGKPINIDNAQIVTSPLIASELKPGGRDYQTFQFLKEKGLSIITPSAESLHKINQSSSETGDIGRLSDADKEILALAIDLKNDDKEIIILTDDYSIQNVANFLNITFQNISQPGITKKFKWTYQCRGCRKRFKENINDCPICGTSLKKVIYDKKDIKN